MGANMFKKKINESNNSIDFDKYSFENICKFVSNTIEEFVKTGIDDKGLSEEESDKRRKSKERLMYSLKNCTQGNYNAKAFVKDFIVEIITKNYDVNKNNINYIVNFDNPHTLKCKVKFDVLLYLYKKQYSYNALSKIIEENKLDSLRKIDNMEYYFITDDDIYSVYKELKPKLEFEDKLYILTQLIYEQEKGLSVIDEIRDMAIDGISGGVNGLPEGYILNNNDLDYYNKNLVEMKLPKSYDSIWILYKGKSIHLRFLSFGSYKNLENVCDNIYKYSNPGSFSKVDGYKINEMADGSRVVVFRPPFAETWMFWIRKFDIPDISLERLIQSNNKYLVINMLKYIIRGCMTLAITGMQAAGKTTLLMSLIEYIYDILNIRVHELFFETHLRKRFPYKNIGTIKQTKNDYDTNSSGVDGQAGLDVLKKTDGSVTIVGEVASDKIAAMMLDVAMVASMFTIFTHHANTFPKLVMSLRNSLLKTGTFNSETIAEEQVLHVLDFNVHLSKDYYGNRYIERITECIPYHNNDKMLYDHVNIIEYDENMDEYIVANKLSKTRYKKMLNTMRNDDRKSFTDFINKSYLIDID